LDVWLDRSLEMTVKECQLRKDAAQSTGRCFTGFSTGIPDLDAMINGINPGSVVVIGGQPGVGKTALALQIATNVAKFDDSVIIYCFAENKLENLHTRMICQYSNLDVTAYTRGLGDLKVFEKAGREHFTATKGRICFKKIDKNFSVKMILEIINGYRREKEPDAKFLVIVDYLQKLAETRHENDPRIAVANASAEFQRLAGDEKDVGVMLISGLSRAAYYGDKMAYGFKESGDIDYDVDVAINLVKSSDPKKTNNVELVVIKNRFGNCEVIELAFDQKNSKFLVPKKEPGTVSFTKKAAR